MYLRRLPREGLECSPWGELARLILRTIPEEFHPQHFGRSERRRRKPEFEVANEEKFAEHLTRYGGISFFFGYDYELATMFDIGDLTWVLLLCKSVSRGARLVTEWFPRLDARMSYGNAGVPDEYEHRNGISLNRTIGSDHAFHGRDVGRYVPGLYWLNYFSIEFASRHNVDVAALASRTGGELIEFPEGHVLKLYDSPARWMEWSESIDQVLFDTPGFFSKRRVQIPQGPLEPREADHVGHEIWKQWP